MPLNQQEAYCEVCGKPADVEVVLYDFYQHGEVFYERDFTCPFLCSAHMIENESQCIAPLVMPPAKGPVSFAELAAEVAEQEALQPKESRKGSTVREYRNGPYYPYTNRGHAQGFTIYRPLL